MHRYLHGQRYWSYTNGANKEASELTYKDFQIVRKPVPPAWKLGKPDWKSREEDIGPDTFGRNPTGSGANRNQGHTSKYVPMCLSRVYL